MTASRLLSLAALTLVVTAPFTRADFLSETVPAIAPAYSSSKGMKIPIPDEVKARKYVGHVTLIRREIAPVLIANPDNGGWTGVATFDLLADVTFDDGQTYLPAHASDIRINFEFTPVIPPSAPDTTEYLLAAHLIGSRDIILVLPGTPNIEIRTSPTPGPGLLLTSSQGPYQISSFFDIFTELSLDNGQTFTPTDAPLRLTAVPEPSSFVLLPLWMHALLRRRAR